MHQPSWNGLTPPAEANANSDAIVNAQLTHLISRDDQAQGQGATSNQDALMPDASMVHDIATPRRTIGGRCHKWCISAQPASGKRKCAACCMCGIRVTHGEARLQQWGSRETNVHCVHAHCVNGVSGMIMNCSRSKLLIRMQSMQSTITRTAADTEVLLPYAQDLDQASTAAPPDDERDLFGREEALRMDEEIMDFQWFEHVTWDSIKDLRGTTYVQPPTRFKFALQQAQHPILRAIIYNNPTSLASESAWKALVLSSWPFLGRPAVNASESNCAHFLDARLELFWDWSSLWAIPVQNATRRTDKQQMQSRVRKVATSARVLVKKDEPQQLPEPHHRSQSRSRLFKRSRVSTRLTQNHQLLCKPQCQPYSCLKWLSMSLPHSERCHDSVNQDHSACARNLV